MEGEAEVEKVSADKRDSQEEGALPDSDAELRKVAESPEVCENVVFFLLYAVGVRPCLQNLGVTFVYWPYLLVGSLIVVFFVPLWDLQGCMVV